MTGVQTCALPISLGEGWTPLIHAQRLGATLGLPQLFIKDESLNPTNSFKARGLSAAVTRAHHLGATTLSIPTAGNAGNAMAAYAASAGITAKVSKPYAILLSSRNICSHFADGNPGNRLRRAGYTSYKWAENLGCRSLSNPYKAVLGSHLYFQSEKSYLGGHYVNLMNATYDRVGLAVVVTRGVLRLVVDFYHP